MENHFDRAAEDLGNIISLEHVNTRIPDQRIATIFYMVGMGFTRDPFVATGVGNMWINVGRHQFHTPIGSPQVLRGHVGLVTPRRESLLARLTQVKADLEGTKFSVTEHDEYVEVISPWGNVFHCYEPEERFGRIILGIGYVQFDVPVGAAAKIARFYAEVFGARTRTANDNGVALGIVSVGNRQDMIFRETTAPIPAYDLHHVQIYLADFSGPHNRLLERGLVTAENGQWEYRFKDMIDLDSGDVLFELEHEVRCMTHPLFGRPFINRDPDMTGPNFAMGREAMAWTTDII